MKKLTLALIAICALGCASQAAQVQKYADFDNSNKTITVPVGSAGLVGITKRVLADNGWTLVVDRGPTVVEGRMSEKVRLEKYDTFNTRYRLYVRSSWRDVCLGSGSDYIKYEIAIVDNKSGAETFTMDGFGCESLIAEKFSQGLMAR